MEHLDSNPPPGSPAVPNPKAPSPPRLRGSTYYLLRQHDAEGFGVSVHRVALLALCHAAELRAEGYHAFVEPVDRECAREWLQLGSGWNPTTVAGLARRVRTSRQIVRDVMTAIAVDGRNSARIMAGVTLQQLGKPTVAAAWAVNLDACRAWLEAKP